MNRRTFLKMAGIGSVSLAAGCTSRPEKHLFSMVQAPADMVTGKSEWYATTCRECPAGCGMLVKNREGRIIKAEGNPLHPVNRGTLCMRGQAALQGVYNPDRLRTPLVKEKTEWRPISFPEAEALVRRKLADAASHGENRVRMLSETAGESTRRLFDESLAAWRSSGPLIFEPFAYESLKAANRLVFGRQGLASYRMDRADFLLSFGADFLETWLSPVEYASKFKKMHALKDGRKPLFLHVSPYRSLTAANADTWFQCRPGGEAAILFGLIRHLLRNGRGKNLPESVRAPLEKTAAPFDPDRVAGFSGTSPPAFERIAGALLAARSPLVLGTGSAAGGENRLQAEAAVSLLMALLDPETPLIDFENRHRVEEAASRGDIYAFFRALQEEPAEILLLNNTNPVFSLPAGIPVRSALGKESLFVVSFSNFMDETSDLADLIFPVSLPLESWGEYGGKTGLASTMQPAMVSLFGAPGIEDLFLSWAYGDRMEEGGFRSYLLSRLIDQGRLKDEGDWLRALQRGGIFENGSTGAPAHPAESLRFPGEALSAPLKQPLEGPVFLAAPSIRFFDGRGANRPWLNEVPDSLTQVAWRTPVLMHPETIRKNGIGERGIVRIRSGSGEIEAPVYETDGVSPAILVMPVGKGHPGYGRYAGKGEANPYSLLTPDVEPVSGAPLFSAGVEISAPGRSIRLANIDGSRSQHGRKIALSVPMKDLGAPDHPEGGLDMLSFPLTPPLPEGYDRSRDFYPPHTHADYRWALAVDLDRCIGCNACAVACYAENNVGIVGEERILEGREMAWLQIHRYPDLIRKENLIFLPMLCQHCDNAPCEPVCPVYASHHSKEGMNNQVYNRCIGTRFCSQNCPYKVRRFNWFDWKWPDPLHMQLNPEVSVRSKGVMEKCSFCVQRIKSAHQAARSENRPIRDGEVVPACAQTCPTGVFTFGNLIDPESRVSRMLRDKRAYQVMGYLNTKPAVIYLKKVLPEI